MLGLPFQTSGKRTHFQAASESRRSSAGICNVQKSRAAAQDVRGFFAATLGRVVAPVREVSWADFLLADFLTSLAKPLSDGERAVCHLLTGPVMDLSPRVRQRPRSAGWPGQSHPAQPHYRARAWQSCRSDR